MGPDPKKQISVSVWLSLDANRKVEDLCREQGIKRAQFVRRAVEEAILRAPEERQIRERIRTEQAREFLRKTERKIRSNEQRSNAAR
jgi:hypothetical protein